MTRRARIGLVFGAVVLLTCGMLTGCSKAAPQTTALSPDKVAQVPDTRGTIPGLELVDVSSLPTDVGRPIGYWADGGSKPENQPRLKKGSYKPILNSDHIAQAELTVAEMDGINQPALLLTFDPAGTKIFGDYATANVGKQMAVVLNGLVLGVPTVEPLTVPGQLQLNLGSDQMNAAKAAIVPAD